jgi:hypothetical protein
LMAVHSALGRVGQLSVDEDRTEFTPLSR